MARKTSPSKLVGEDTYLTFNFLDELGWGDLVQTAVSSAVVISGVDPNPEFILRDFPRIQPNSVDVMQLLRLGVPGVIYRVSVQVTSVAGEVYVKDNVVAVLPDGSAKPDYISEYLSSVLYPVLFDDSLGTSSLLAGASLVEQVIVGYLDDSLRTGSTLIGAAIIASPDGFMFDNLSTTPSLQGAAFYLIIETTMIDNLGTGSTLQSGAFYLVVENSSQDNMSTSSSLIGAILV